MYKKFITLSMILLLLFSISGCLTGDGDSSDDTDINYENLSISFNVKANDDTEAEANCDIYDWSETQNLETLKDSNIRVNDQTLELVSSDENWLMFKNYNAGNISPGEEVTLSIYHEKLDKTEVTRTIPSTPTNLKVDPGDFDIILNEETNQVNLAWDEVDTIDSYQVTYSRSNEADFNRFTTYHTVSSTSDSMGIEELLYDDLIDFEVNYLEFGVRSEKTHSETLSFGDINFDFRSPKNTVNNF